MIRRAAPSDATALAALACELGYPSTAEEARTRLDALLQSATDAVLVAEEDGNVTGWIHVSLVLSLESAAFAEIRGLVVTERRRGSGIGAQLVAAAEDWARAHGQQRVRVRSNVTRERTHRFYERLGYTTTKTSKVFDKDLGL